MAVIRTADAAAKKDDAGVIVTGAIHLTAVPGQCGPIKGNKNELRLGTGGQEGDIIQAEPEATFPIGNVNEREIRVETSAHSDCTVSPYYDSLIAKVVVHGRDRQEAIARMRRTLEMTVIEGIKTSIPLHLRILDDPEFVAGKLSTSFMDRFLARPRPGRLAEAV